ncbi:hypothetical protein P170DRAFT_434474 [Aspergillus steynii IBT 23096]|uniref:Transcriptional regulator n=1 Tax=Aspergillus steynii IBT 23096 TaxID=1392250 RepID=A0A2I2GIP6_9EURO|nr:uncharacterized protein P170DRAFT_434474 [Aspergillus steynii IBT 23096]PLB52754.1 hypothetical protein P170DRAFT_434474 [Aspergillus steynii IBT 23096]
MAPRYALSDSEAESELDQPTAPSDDALEKALRDTVAEIYRTGNMEELTVKRVRLAAEKSLQLEPGFFKTDNAWKTKSEQIIREAVESQDAAGQSNDEEEEEKAPSPPPSKSNPAKRTKADASAPRKRRKASTPDPEDDKEEENEDGNEEQGSDAASDEGKEKAKKPTKGSKAKQGQKLQPKPKGKTAEVSDDAKEHDAKEQDTKPSEEPKVDQKDDSESEMSVVLDEEPEPTRKRQKSSEAAAPKGKKKAAAKPKDADVDPNEAEIKRLQGWLVKCGIRKMWWRELAPYDSPKAKIKHLKEMLKDAGMGGRYSVEKANRIREERELRADLELVQEGAKRWGTGSGDEGSDSAQPRRRLNRGRKTLAFLDSDGEGTD